MVILFLAWVVAKSYNIYFDTKSVIMSNSTLSKTKKCAVCNYPINEARLQDFGEVRGNTERLRHTNFQIWKCPECLSIISIDLVDYHDIYSDYPLNKRQLDVFAKGTLGNLLKRLRNAGMKTTDTILDYGCGNGIFIDFLKSKGYQNVVGYDPYFPKFANLPIKHTLFDVIVNNDTLEHCDNINAMLQENLERLKPGGLLYLGTSDSEPVSMSNLESHIMRLHQPFHRVIITEQTLHNLSNRYKVDLVASYRRSYHDTLRPFSNYRFLDELNKAVGHNLDSAMDASITNHIFLSSPRLWFFALFGYWFPSAFEPAIVVRMPLG